MNDKTPVVNWSFWVIGSVALIWNLMGSINFVMQMNPEVVAQMPESHRMIIGLRPFWATIAFALAVFGGTLACIMLLLRKSSAFYLFVASLIGVLVTMIPHIHLVGSSIHKPFEILMMIAMPILVAVFLLWYVKWAESKTWLS